jgi:hypothetical protein
VHLAAVAKQQAKAIKQAEKVKRRSGKNGRLKASTKSRMSPAGKRKRNDSHIMESAYSSSDSHDAPVAFNNSDNIVDGKDAASTTTDGGKDDADATLIVREGIPDR